MRKTKIIFAYNISFEIVPQFTKPEELVKVVIRLGENQYLWRRWLTNDYTSQQINELNNIFSDLSSEIKKLSLQKENLAWQLHYIPPMPENVKKS